MIEIGSAAGQTARCSAFWHLPVNSLTARLLDIEIINLHPGPQAKREAVYITDIKDFSGCSAGFVVRSVQVA
jgi:hypothetical protein